MSAATRDPTTPGAGGVRSALAGFLVLAASSAAARYGPEASAAAGTLMEQLILPAVGGALLGLGTFARKKRADLKRIL